MTEFVTLSCPSCGAKLQISNDLDKFACSYCGNEHVVRRSGGVISLAPVVEQLKGVKAGVDKTASELAIRRLKEEIADLRSQRAAINDTGCLTLLFSKVGGFAVLAIFIIAIVITNVGWSMDLDGDTIGAVSFGVGLVLLVAAALYIDLRGGTKANTARNTIDQAISKKVDELNYHENLVRN